MKEVVRLSADIHEAAGLSDNPKEIVPSSKQRRRFIDSLLLTSFSATFASIFYPIIKFLIPPQVVEASQASVVAGKLSELKANTGKIFKFGTKPGIIVKKASGEVCAFSATCTHLNCTVQYREDSQEIWCACHNGRYDLNGKNIAGPPPRPLEQFEVKVRGDEIFVSKG
ncbi:MAG: Rieske (2Fe-2S) protein [Acidobacteriota bacterium]